MRAKSVISICHLPSWIEWFMNVHSRYIDLVKGVMNQLIPGLQQFEIYQSYHDWVKSFHIIIMRKAIKKNIGMPLTESLKVVNPTGPTGLLHFWHLKLFGWGGWATPPKSMTSSVGIMTFPTELNNKTCSKPPTSIIIYYRCIHIYIYIYIYLFTHNPTVK